MATSIPVIDLFAGPGGLGEGISSVRGDDGRPVFDIRLSVEKDPIAHRTLSLRAIYRRLSEHGRPPDCYYNYLRGSISRDALLEHPAVREAAREALEESRCAELGGAKQSEIDKRIANALPPGKEWVLIGGPPCQAYSLVGRSRMRSTNPIAFAEDKRHLLYQQYLRIISRHRPAMFVMENVKGLLSSVHDGGMIFQRIISDLKSPGLGLEYEIRSLNTGASHEGLTPSDFIVRAEDYGVPQSRHRVILLGIRKDLAGKPHQPLEKVKSRTSLKIALDGLPAIRSRISREPDSFAKWVSVLEGTERLLGTLSGMKEREIRTHVREAIEKAKGHDPGCGDGRIHHPARYGSHRLHSWYSDPWLGVILGHESRSHMAGDLQRYLFAAAFAEACDRSPKLADFPEGLLPKHRNIKNKIVPFEDRFKVQTWKTPSSTVVSHIAKDGHYYIHPAPSQCRSLTVREAARLQTFPDNYLFEGNRTQQYVQVGNAVPPYLAMQIGDILADFMGTATMPSAP